jgi:hypothetical protein
MKKSWRRLRQENTTLKVRVWQYIKNIDKVWNNRSQSVKDFISALMNFDTKYRLTAT